MLRRHLIAQGVTLLVGAPVTQFGELLTTWASCLRWSCPSASARLT